MTQYRYFIKRLGSQEMGSRQSRDGKGSRGRYILLPGEALDIFPKLSTERLNDSTIVGFIPIYRSKDGGRPPKCYLKYIYHNSKPYLEKANGRNERRIYLSKTVDEGCFYQGDIVVVRRRVDDDQANLLEDDYEDEKREAVDVDSKAGYEYYVDWIRQDLNPEEWNVYDLWIKAFSKSRSPSCAILDERIDMFETKAAAARPDGISIDEQIIKDFRKVSPITVDVDGLRSYAGMFSAQSFRDFVISAYENTCAVTHEVISFGSLNNLEVAHFQPIRCGGLHLPQNGIALRRDIRWAFDKGMFCIEPETLTIHVHPRLSESYLSRYEGRSISLKTRQFAPLPCFLKYHLNHIYGSFEQTAMEIP